VDGRHPSYRFTRNLHVRDLCGHRNNKGIVKKIPVVRALVARKSESVDPIIEAFAVVFVGIMQSEDCMHEEPESKAVDVQRIKPYRHPLVDAPRESRHAFHRIRLDTYVGMAFADLVALAVIMTTAATLHAKGVTDIESSQQAAEALRPVVGNFVFLIFSLGIIGTGLLAVPVLAGSTAYAIGEARHWKVGLGRRPTEAKAFYAVVAIATLIGMIINFTPVNPIKALYWAAVLNGIVSVPVLVTMLLMASNPKVMGRFRVLGALRWIGWIATGVMALCAIGTIGGLFF
jgi:Mn2+/Fe2+ NRAMP family transporter